MRLDELPTSARIEDRPGELNRFPGGHGGIGIGTIVVLGLICWALGIDPRILIGGAEMMSGNGETQQQADAGSTASTGAPSDEMGHFVSAVLGSTEAQWTDIFAQAGKTYKPPTLVIFFGSTRSGCGTAHPRWAVLLSARPESLSRYHFLSGSRTALSGLRRGQQDLPVLPGLCDCPRDRPPRAEPAGIAAAGAGGPARDDKVEANNLQVRVELQADCLAGVWANRAQQRWQFIESGDVEAALQTASAIGDDRLQRQAQGYVVPDAFTHGSSAQRTRWFMTGLRSGNVASCDTFRTAALMRRFGCRQPTDKLEIRSIREVSEHVPTRMLRDALKGSRS
jgi:uncharacterized protein